MHCIFSVVFRINILVIQWQFRSCIIYVSPPLFPVTMISLRKTHILIISCYSGLRKSWNYSEIEYSFYVTLKNISRLNVSTWCPRAIDTTATPPRYLLRHINAIRMSLFLQAKASKNIHAVTNFLALRFTLKM